ncbi:MAG TPA: hypothetical protein VFL85_03810 [Candidatus Saccharimonadales bacterium]|nr:hypothetical protein [Candidatus Saccharimonadales bacterium]
MRRTGDRLRLELVLDSETVAAERNFALSLMAGIKGVKLDKLQLSQTPGLAIAETDDQFAENDLIGLAELLPGALQLLPVCDVTCTEPLRNQIQRLTASGLA